MRKFLAGASDYYAYAKTGPRQTCRYGLALWRKELQVLGRLTAFLFWAFIVWVLVWGFLEFSSFEHLFPNAALVFPIELFTLKVMLGLFLALVLLNPFGLFSINIPSWTAFVIMNRATRRLHVFGPGQHIKFPWEFTFQGPVCLEVTNHSIDIHLITTDRMEVSYQVHIGYSPHLGLLPLYLRNTDRQIKNRIESVIHEVFTAQLSATLSTELDDQEVTSQLEHLLKRYFAPGSGQYAGTLSSELGIRLEEVSVSKPRFSYASARMSVATELEDGKLSNSLSHVLAALGQLPYGK